MQRVQIYQIYYNEATRKLMSEARDGEILHTAATPLLENNAIRQFFETGRDPMQYTGILSARFEQKLVWKNTVDNIGQAKRAIEADNYAHDVYTFFGAFTQRNVWKVAERWQPGCLEAGRYLCAYLFPKVADITALDTPIVYQNAFIARNDVYATYAREVLMPAAMFLAESDHLQNLLDKDSKYNALHRLKGQDCVRVFGRSYYTLHPFVWERLFSTWLAVNNSVTFKHI